MEPREFNHQWFEGAYLLCLPAQSGFMCLCGAGGHKSNEYTVTGLFCALTCPLVTQLQSLHWQTLEAPLVFGKQQLFATKRHQANP